MAQNEFIILSKKHLDGLTYALDHIHNLETCLQEALFNYNGFFTWINLGLNTFSENVKTLNASSTQEGDKIRVKREDLIKLLKDQYVRYIPYPEAPEAPERRPAATHNPSTTNDPSANHPRSPSTKSDIYDPIHVILGGVLVTILNHQHPCKQMFEWGVNLRKNLKHIVDRAISQGGLDPEDWEFCDADCGLFPDGKKRVITTLLRGGR